MSTGDIIAADVKASRIAELVKQNKAVNLALEREKVHRRPCILWRRCVALSVEVGPTTEPAVWCGLWAVFLQTRVLVIYCGLDDGIPSHRTAMLHAGGSRSRLRQMAPT
jgi:hypothetical protein